MPIVAVVLMLITKRAKADGLAFLAGWIVGIALAGAIVLAVVSPSDTTDEGAPATWVNWLKLIVGVLLLLVAVREWQKRPAPGEDVAMSKWMGALDDFTPVKAGGLAVLLGAVNPKNLLFIVGGATVVAQAQLSGGDQAITWAGVHAHCHHRRCRTDRHLLRHGHPRGGDPRRTQDVDGSQQHRGDGGTRSDHRREVDRRRDLGLQRVISNTLAG
jgi:threonine/homoserine/homoserine lactone efflux protein